MLGLGKLDWRGRRGERAGNAPMPLVASRDLPPVDAFTPMSLPQSPDPMPEEALVFARDAARRNVARDDADDAASSLSAIAAGTDLRDTLKCFETANRRREALRQSARARARLVDLLSAGRAQRDGTAPLKLVGADEAPDMLDDCGTDAEIEQAMEEALSKALGTLQRLSALSQN